MQELEPDNAAIQRGRHALAAHYGISYATVIRLEIDAREMTGLAIQVLVNELSSQAKAVATRVNRKVIRAERQRTKLKAANSKRVSRMMELAARKGRAA